MSDDWEAIGNNDLRLLDNGAGGFRHVVLKDVDDGDWIVVNEDDLEALRDRLSVIINEMKSEISGRN